MGFTNPNFRASAPEDDSEQHRDSYQHNVSIQNSMPNSVENGQRLTEAEIRRLPLVNDKGKQVFSQRKLDKMVFKKVESSICYLYKLESFFKKRRIEEKYEPYSHQNQTFFPEPMGMATDMWNTKVYPDFEFKKHVKKLEIPGSSRVQRCHDCHVVGIYRCSPCGGTGRVRCGECNGTGRKAVGQTHLRSYCHEGTAPQNNCTLCHGSGVRDCFFCQGNRDRCIHCRNQGYTNCTWCNRNGEQNCVHYQNCHACHKNGYKCCGTCNGVGRTVCGTCNGLGNLRFFSQLVVEFDVEKSMYYTDQFIPIKKLVKASGNLVLHQERENMIQPLANFRDPKVAHISEATLAEHLHKLQATPDLIAIPMTKIEYTQGSEDNHFWVYGNEKFCHAEVEEGCCNCCCGCSII